MQTNKGTIVVAELIGTFVLVLGGCGTAVLAGKSVGALGVALAFGISLLCMVYAIGGISGCHINPAVTLGLVLAGKCRSDDALYYVLGQVIGAIIAGGVLFAIAISQAGATASSVRATGFAANGYGIHSPELYKLVAAILVETVLTAVFVFIICSTFHRAFPVGFGGVAIGLALTLVHLISIPVDNTSVNPARSIGVAVYTGGWALTQLWVFIVFPLVGGALGALTWRLLSGEEVISASGDAVRPE